MNEHPGRAGVQVPHVEIVVREVLGRPVVTHVRPMTRLEIKQQWGRFTGGSRHDRR